MSTDRTALIDRGRADLARLIVLLFALVGKASPRLPRAVHLAALRMVRPAESALRRLIVVAAGGLKVRGRVQAAPVGCLPKIAGARVGAFPLFDTRRRVGPRPAPPAGPGPRIRFFDAVEPEPDPPAPPRGADAAALRRRIARLDRALERLPQEARRLARWRARNPDSPRRPMRPGRPPGYRRRAGDDPAQAVLRDLQMAALHAMRPETA